MHPSRIAVFSALIAGLLCAAATAPAQIGAGGRPASFGRNLSADIDAFVLPGLGQSAPRKQAEAEETAGAPYRFGHPFDVNLGLDEAGTWEELPDGGLLWRLRIECPGAYSINLIYDEFQLPAGATFFLYNDDHSSLLGAFTSENLLPEGGFATGFTKGPVCTLEYYEPPGGQGSGQIHISRVVHGFRDVFQKIGEYFGQSGACNINTACPEAASLADQARSVGLLLTGGGTSFCSGVLLNNVRQDRIPYFLTANQCYSSDFATWIVMFNYQSPECQPSQDGPTTHTITGTKVCARNSSSDFLLLRLNSEPPSRYRVFYAGWSNLDIPATSAAGIHHPRGDVKKISFTNKPVISTDYRPSPYLADSHWEVPAWDAGTVEPGSTGSPLFDQNRRVTGQLHGGYASCANIAQSYYGKFSMSWNRGTTATSRLQDWLDPDATGAVTLDGLDFLPEPELVIASFAFTDTCPGEKQKSGDGILDAGETAGLQITVRNDGTLPADGITATLACANPQLIITRGTASWPALAIGAAAPNDPPGFEVLVHPDTPCNTVFDATVTFRANSGREWVQHLELRTGLIEEAVLLEEAFETWPPAGWNIVRTGGSCGWEPNRRQNSTGGAGSCAEANSDVCGAGVAVDTELRTPVIDLTGYTGARLEYKLYFLYYASGGSDFADVDISTNGGTGWINLKHYSSTRAVAESLDLAAYLGRTVIIRFRYAGVFDWYCQVDDVRLSARQPCRQQLCTAPAPAAPSDLQAVPGGSGTINLSWTDRADNETGFEIQRQAGGTVNWTAVFTTGPDATSWQDTGLTAGTLYWYRVRAVNQLSVSDWSNEAGASTPPAPPAAPANLQAVAAVPAAINLTWQDNSDDETGFQIERLAGVPGSDWAAIALTGPGVTAYQDRTLPPVTLFRYRVRAVNAAGYSDWSNEASATSPGVPPEAPSNLQAIPAGPTIINLTWQDNSGDETGFQIERRLAGATVWTAVATTGAGQTSYPDTGLTASTTYRYRVRAINSWGESAWSNETGASTLPVPPAAPSNLQTSPAGASSISLTWQDNSTDETGFQIERETGAPGSGWSAIALTGPGVKAYQDTALPPLTLFRYRVRAVNAAGYSGWSNESAATTNGLPPAAPSNLQASPAGPAAVNLSWQDNSGDETGFQIERRRGTATAWILAVTTGPDQIQYQDNGLEALTTYTYRIRAANAWGVSAWSGETTVTTPPALPAAPSNLRAAPAGATSISLTWQDNSTGETGFQIERTTDAPGEAWQSVTVTVPGATNYQDGNLMPGSTYRYHVRAISGAGYSAWSNEATATTPVPPAAPANLQARIMGPTWIQLTWQDLSTNETGFQIQRRAGADGSWVQLATAPADLTSYDDRNATAGILYTYRVRAVDAGSESPWSNEVTAATAPPVLAPSNLQAIPGGPDSILLKWQDNSFDEDGFLIQFRPAASAGWDSAPGTVTGADMTGTRIAFLSPGTAYIIRIQARRQGTGSAWSTEATATTASGGCPNTPESVIARWTGPESILLTWNDRSNNETGFIIERRSNSATTHQIHLDANATLYQDTGLISGKVYWYTVLARNASCVSSFSFPSPETGRLTPPVIYRWSPHYTTTCWIDLSWLDTSSAETGFEVERRTLPDGNWEVVTRTSAAYCSDPNLRFETTYAYRIRAYRNNGEFSEYSQTIVCTTPKPMLPGAPSGLWAVAQEENKIQLTWKSNSGQIGLGFQVERKSGPDGGWVMIATVPGDTVVYEDEGLAVAAAYCYRVRAYNAGGMSNPSNEAWAETPGAGYDAIIPAAAHTTGVNGTAWRSAVDLLNTGGQDAPVTISLLLKAQANPDPETVSVNVPAGRCLRLPDVLGSVFQATNGALGLRFGGRPVRANSLFFNIEPGCEGSFGMIIPAFKEGQALTGDGLHLGTFHFLSYDPSGSTGFRTNIGFTNAGGFPVLLRIRLYNGQGAKLGELQYTLKPYEHQQITRIHEYLKTPAVTAGSATVEVLTIGGKVFPYAMLIDNISGDPLYMPPDIIVGTASGLAKTGGEESGAAAAGSPAITTPAIAAAAASYDLYIPAAAHTGGVNNTLWRTDLDLLNPGAKTAKAEIALLLAGQANPSPATVQITVPAKSVVRLPDVLAEIFQAGNAALGIRFIEERILANARFFNSNSTCTPGSYGMLVPGTGGLDAVIPGRPAIFHHLGYSPDPAQGVRTNIGFVNASAFQVLARLRLFGDGGDEIGEKSFVLRAFEHAQFTRVHALLGTEEVTAGWASLEVLTPGGAVHPYVMVIDNISGDPVYMAAETDLAAGDLAAESPVAGNLRLAPAGRYLRGSPLDEPCRSETEQQIMQTVKYDLAVMETEVTRGMWAQLAARQPSLIPDPSDAAISPGPHHPVQNVTLREAVLFANLLSVEEGKQPCYYKNQALSDVVDAGDFQSGTIYYKLGGTGYRLPVEGEWEYFCRAGTSGPFPVEEAGFSQAMCKSETPDALTGLGNLAWWCGNADGTAHPAGLKAGNPWNLKDVSGNIKEWCGSEAFEDSSGILPDESICLIRYGIWYRTRGGGYSSWPESCRSAGRDSSPDFTRSSIAGFRLVRAVR